MDLFTVRDKVVLLTGSSGLIGGFLKDLLLKNGAFVIAADLRVAQRKYDRAGCLEIPMDITDDSSILNCINAGVKEFGRIDVLINNAAIDAKFEGPVASDLSSIDFSEFPFELLQKSIEVNVSGTIRITQLVAQLMLKQSPVSGHIINLASTYSLVGTNPSLYDRGDGVYRNKPMDYVATKSFIPNFTKYLAVHYGKKGIRVNAIAPHGIYNNHQPPFITHFEELSPMGRMCDIQELAGPFLFLVSDASSYMTGHTLVVDGGWTAM